MRNNRPLFCLFLFLLFFFLFYSMVGENEKAFGEEASRRELVQKVFDVNGQIKIGHFLYSPDEEAELYKLEYSQKTEESASADQFSFILWGKHEWQTSYFFWKARSYLYKNDSGWESENNLDEAFFNWPYNSKIRWEGGKKILLWGKAHSWNPLGFLSTPRDPLDTELSREFPQEGIVYLGAEYKRKFPPGPDPLQELTFRPLVFPVQGNVNESFGPPSNFQEHEIEPSGESKHWNLAGRLSLLFWNTDIDLCFLKGESRPDRYGFSFSRDLDTHLEFHGDFWIIPEYEKIFLDSTGELCSTVYAGFGNLVGFCYNQGENNRYIVEYYRNKAGFTQEEMKNYYECLHELDDPNQGSVDRDFISDITEDYYHRPDLMQEYIFAKMIRQEPLDIRYLTFSVAGIWNIQDRSYAISPELYYKSNPNLSIKMKGIFLEGDPFTEFGEKADEWKVEVSLTYLFGFSFYQLLYPHEKVQDSLNRWR